MIVVDQVTKTYGNKKILQNVSFTVEGGELVSIVGPSASGKTTLFYSIIGAETVDSGNIFVDQYEVSKLKTSKIQEYRRKIGIIFQDYKLLPKKTVFENVAFALEMAGYPKRFIGKRTKEVLKLTGIEEQRNNFPHQLSGGEQQRAAIARALVHAPELLIADEPTGNLDPDNAIALAKLFLKINRTGTTILIATHNKDIVNEMERRVISIQNGRIISDKQNAGYK
ncbi:ATP-binding cassette domain-containing protein [Candidatus Peregrinibacteria bacterium]|nr:ATP-binding cassette domain-containing protein [Candidatus Peregrinibacteria bacterium]